MATTGSAFRQYGHCEFTGDRALRRISQCVSMRPVPHKSTVTALKHIAGLLFLVVRYPTGSDRPDPGLRNLQGLNRSRIVDGYALVSINNSTAVITVDPFQT